MARIFAVGQEAVGIIAIGQLATGVIAIGQLATGVVAVGQLARGVIVCGQLAVGGATLGQLSVGLYKAVGMVGMGLRAGPGAIFPVLPRAGGRWGILRVAALVVLVTIVVIAAGLPLWDALTRTGGIFRAPEQPLR